MDVLAAATRGCRPGSAVAGLALGDLQVDLVGSRALRVDETGKLWPPNPTFKQIANGLPGVEVRMPLLFDMTVSKGAWA